MGVGPRGDLAALRGGVPGSSAELVERLAELARLASRWSDLVRELQEPTHRMIGTAAAASVGVAARRAEEAFLELEVTLGDAQAARRSLPPVGLKSEDDHPMV
ncbi:hypothetical protein GCM10010492_37230 [Saccharothrix mutabilis subsp. mutabilis]|uniref:HPt domain-containing protein n=1 Tax=Saccharothrix mutabilis subsp. mutabilis TaxID=66855 RepID=A0ABN0U0H0_9PSEU